MLRHSFDDRSAFRIYLRKGGKLEMTVQEQMLGAVPFRDIIVEVKPNRNRRWKAAEQVRQWTIVRPKAQVAGGHPQT